jgi:hypothetical protein
MPSVGVTLAGTGASTGLMRAASSRRRRCNAEPFACLLVPALPLAAELRAHPELLGRPLAIAAGPGPRAEIVAVSPEAARAGVRTLTSVVHGRATCAALVVRVLSPALDRAARDALLDAALASSPRAEHAPTGSGAYSAEAAVFVDARGVAALFHSEAGFATALAERARRLGLPAGFRSVVAQRGADRGAPARDAAASIALKEEGARDVRAIAPEDERRFLAPLPLDLLSPDDDQAEALSRLGLRRIEDLLRCGVTRPGHPKLARARARAGSHPAATRTARAPPRRGHRSRGAARAARAARLRAARPARPTRRAPGLPRARLR